MLCRWILECIKLLLASDVVTLICLSIFLSNPLFMYRGIVKACPVLQTNTVSTNEQGIQIEVSWTQKVIR